ncbi:hypothetical protein F5Y13DRAFT_189928 [Hypoxylon sp. FL1857]|nr:hypothetical protein F5Y13DRAFT_189928 [Hypoxylon sp. FL1857]
MAAVFDVGKVVDLSPGLGSQPPVTYNGIMTLADKAPLSDKEVAKKAVEDTKEVPSVWFVNFPDKAAAEHTQVLRKYMQSVEDYRCWASLTWWRTVYGNSQIPQDGAQKSIAARSSYCAKVATHHMKSTPWLAMNIDHNLSKEIKCKVSDFHAELIKAVLLGFVGVTAGVVRALEGILESLRLTIQQSSSNSENKTIVCEHYEYIPQADAIKSYVRVISFSVTNSMKNVQNAKKTEREIKCTIDYNDYEADFNQKRWDDAAAGIDAEQKKATDDFIKKQTVDCPP